MDLGYKGTHCIVTGGSGFIGQNLVQNLVEQGASVYVLDNFSYGAKQSSIHPDAHVCHGNIATYESFEKLPAKEYSYLFHFAGPSSVVSFTRTPTTCINETVSGFMNASRYCSTRSIKLIFPSSGSLYSGTPIPQKETSQLQTETMNIYAKTKYKLENLQDTNTSMCNSLALRIFAGYGPQESHKGEIASVVYSFCKKMYTGQRPIIYGDGNQERDFIYISDITEAILTLAKNCDEKIVNIGSGTSISFTNLITAINSVLGSNLEPIYVNKPTGYLEKTLAELSLFKKYTEQTATPIKEGIARIIRSF